MVKPYVPAVPLGGLPIQFGRVHASNLTHWEEVGLMSVGDLFCEGEVVKFQTLTEENGLHGGPFPLHERIPKALQKTLEYNYRGTSNPRCSTDLAHKG